MKKIISAALVILFCQSLAYAGAAIPEDTKIILKRGMCFGTCPGYTLTIFADGKVVYEGERYVRILGHQEKTIPVDKLRQLLEKFSEMDFPSLVAKIAALDCNYYVFDGPSTEVSLIKNGKSFTAIHGEKCNTDSLFKLLDNLAKTIDDTVDVKDWTAPSEFKKKE